MHWLVVGAGISGLSAARLLKSEGHDVTIANDTPIATESSRYLENLGITYVEASSVRQIDAFSSIVRSPGIADDHSLVEQARSRHIPLTSEIELALERFQGKVVGITGTNGKSTTCALTAHVLEKAGFRAVACGNIGRPPCDLIYDGEEYDYWVVELSSYQIDIAQQLVCDTVAFTSFSQDHLGRHGTLENYFRAKWALISALPKAGYAFVSDEVYQVAQSYGFSVDRVQRLKPLAPQTSTPFIARHDFLNSAFAIHAAGAVTGTEATDFIPHLASFTCLPHRYERVPVGGSTLIINDSKATNVDSVIRALENQVDPCILLLGGQGKGESFQPILRYKENIAQIYLFGQDREQIRADLGSEVAISSHDSLAELMPVLKAAGHTETILFSPGCASFDEFTSFAARGDYFKKMMLK